MKKFVAIVFAVLYLGVSSGLAVEIHHCMGKLTGMSLIPSATNKCHKCGMAKGSNPCCKDELKFVKLPDSHKLVTPQDQLAGPGVLPVQKHYLANSIAALQPFLVPSRNLSPHDPPLSLIILNCVFRI